MRREGNIFFSVVVAALDACQNDPRLASFSNGSFQAMPRPRIVGTGLYVFRYVLAPSRPFFLKVGTAACKVKQ